MHKAQSAMEYLMTYGWAILIIAVVLAALFELGVFNGSNLAPQACIAQAGFVCRNPVYTANGIGITFGQTTGREYFDSFMFIAAEGEPLNSMGVPQNFTANDLSKALFIGNLLPGQTVGADFNSSKFAYGQIPANAPIGTPFAGYVWLGYCLSPCSTPTAYSKVATITAKEAGTSSASFGGYFGGGSGSAVPPPSGPQAGNVIFTADPLPAGTLWSVTYNGVMESANTPSNIVFTDIPTDISLPYTINAPIVTSSACYSTNSISGNAISGQTVQVPFSQVPCYVNITIDSTGGSASAGFQQMLQFNPSSYHNYEVSDLGNLRFYQGNTGLYSWCESGCTSGSTSAIFWVKTNGLSSGMNANAITMDFEPPLGNKGQYSGPSGHAGEAPQLSSSYGQYDNGANVFEFYDNFSGSSLNTNKWSIYATGSYTATYDNHFNLAAQGGWSGYYFIYSKSEFPQGSVAETLFSSSDAIATGTDSLFGFSSSNTQGLSPDGNGASSSPFVTWGMNSPGNPYYSIIQGDRYSYADSSTGNSAPFSSQIWGVYYTGSTNYFYWNNYTAYSSLSSYSPLGNAYAAFGFYFDYGGLSAPVSITYQWVRVRAYPPNGAMPKVSFGTPQ